MPNTDFQNGIIFGSVAGGNISKGSSTIDTQMSDTSENAVQNKVIKKYVDDSIDLSKNSIVSLKNAVAPDYIVCGYTLDGTHILTTFVFNTSGLNFSVPENSVLNIENVYIGEDDEYEIVPLSALNDYIKELESFSTFYGSGWIQDGDSRMFLQDFGFLNSAAAQSALEDLNSSVPIVGYDLTITLFKRFEAQPKEE